MKAHDLTKVGLLFRGDFFNLFNHPNLGLPIGDATPPRSIILMPPPNRSVEDVNTVTGCQTVTVA